MEKLEKEGLGDGTVHWLKLDLSDPRSAKNAAEEFMKIEDRLDILGTSSLQFCLIESAGQINR